MMSVREFDEESSGLPPALAAAGGSLGRLLAPSGRTRVRGGQAVPSGVAAAATLSAAGGATGVIPRRLAGKEVARRGSSDLRVGRVARGGER